MNTRFNVDDAESLKLHLQNLRETLKSEWSNVISAWQNLQANWNDVQRDKFEDSFQRLLTDYQTIEQATEKYTQQLSEQIQITQQQSERLNALNK
jgi:DNA repair ATPase RecN